MPKSTFKLAPLVLVSCFASSGVIAETEQEKVNPIYEVVLASAYVVKMNKAELNRAIHVIHKFQAGNLPLPELDALSDQEVLGKIDFNAEPYSEMMDEMIEETMMIIWKRYEIEAEMLAEKADVDPTKFGPFYRSFIRTIATGKKIHNYQVSLRNSDFFGSYSSFNSSSNDFEVECAASCQAIRDGDIDSTAALLAFLADMNAQESVNGPQAIDSTVRIGDSVSRNSVEVKKNFGEVDWAPTGNTDR